MAALLDVSMVSDITAVIDANTFERPIYAGNAIATVKSSENVVVVSVRGTAFEPAELTGSASIESVDIAEDADKSSFVKEELAKTDRPELTSANIVVSGVVHWQVVRISPNTLNLWLISWVLRLVPVVLLLMEVLYPMICKWDKLVKSLHLICTLPSVFQGDSAFGRHEGFKTIVAINNDPESPIASVADYFLEGDLFHVVPELIEKL